ncbi:hypothetical protein LCGC14_2809810 [marine sediment metagenome]|uniref:Uncharacterized protein n=1 Tax=marine sediment metagenome TaxID=412755 RepID=A0A0F8Z717_9ZZZZ
MSEQKTIQEATRTFTYELAKSIGAIWLVKKIPWLELKPWYKELDDKKTNAN